MQDVNSVVSFAHHRTDVIADSDFVHQCVGSLPTYFVTLGSLLWRSKRLAAIPSEVGSQDGPRQGAFAVSYRVMNLHRARWQHGCQPAWRLPCCLRGVQKHLFLQAYDQTAYRCV